MRRLERDAKSVWTRDKSSANVDDRTAVSAQSNRVTVTRIPHEKLDLAAEDRQRHSVLVAGEDRHGVGPSFSKAHADGAPGMVFFDVGGTR